MCGIAGIMTPRPHSDTAATVQAMMKAMAHRGPDAQALSDEGLAALGHLRLSILDVSARGNQPMEDHTGRYVLIHNGEIYNFKEIRRELDYPWRTETDTEMILAAWSKWGPACLKRFNGMFAFALYDRAQKALFVARDRLGIKPVYYHVAEQGLAFASETRGLLQTPWLKGRVNRSNLAAYLCYQTTYGSGTLLEDVELLEAGHYLRYQNGKASVERYYALHEAAKAEITMSRSSILNMVREKMQAAVERRLISDVPLGAFLSGGIDSSAVVALMSEVSGKPVDTFSVVFQEKEYDESRWSKMIAEKYNTRHHPILLRPSDFLEALPEALKAMDHPSGDGINSYVVSQVTKAQGITVALSGLGGDELFAGYPIFTQLPDIQKRSLWKVPALARKPLSGVYGMLKKGRQADKVKQLLRLPNADMPHIYKVFRTIYNWEQARQLAPTNQPHPLDALLAEARQLHPLLSKISLAEISSYTHSVLLRDTDQMSMAHALEVRVPFFDHELVELALRIPDQHKRPKYPKQLLVDALGDLLPNEVVHRKKMGFVFPWEHWLRNELRDFCDARIRRLADRKLLNSDLLMKAWKEFEAGRGEWLWTHIWLPVVLEEWMTNQGVNHV
ncbi:MAG: asparagine synthase (glutamine-hydrolyzing) [Bacteroidota bacterium]